MKNLPAEFEDDIPLGHALFLVREGMGGAEMIPELMTFQIDGKLFDPDKIDADILDEELLSSLDNLRDLLRAKAEERQS